jgi:hypothetical protein
MTIDYDRVYRMVHDIMLIGLDSNTVYHFKITLKDPVGNTVSTQDMTFNTGLPGPGIETGTAGRPVVSLEAWPNPFNGAVGISWAIYCRKGGIQTTKTRNSWNAAPTPRLAIYDLHGRIIHLSDVQSERYVWNATGLPAGVYIAKLTLGNNTFSERLTLLK